MLSSYVYIYSYKALTSREEHLDLEKNILSIKFVAGIKFRTIWKDHIEICVNYIRTNVNLLWKNIYQAVNHYDWIINVTLKAAARTLKTFTVFPEISLM